MFFSMVRLVLLLRIRIGSMISLSFGGGSCRLHMLLWLLPLIALVTGVRTPNAKKMCCCYIRSVGRDHIDDPDSLRKALLNFCDWVIDCESHLSFTYLDFR